MYLTWIDCTKYIHCKDSNGCQLDLYIFYRLNLAELGFLAEYAAIMKPVTLALNILQGWIIYAYELPAANNNQLQEKLNKQESACKVCTPLIDALQHGIQKRFGEAMKDPELIAAAILLPRFRASWTTDDYILKSVNILIYQFKCKSVSLIIAAIKKKEIMWRTNYFENNVSCHRPWLHLKPLG